MWVMGADTDTNRYLVIQNCLPIQIGLYSTFPRFCSWTYGSPTVSATAASTCVYGSLVCKVTDKDEDTNMDYIWLIRIGDIGNARTWTCHSQRSAVGGAGGLTVSRMQLNFLNLDPYILDRAVLTCVNVYFHILCPSPPRNFRIKMQPYLSPGRYYCIM